MAESLQQFAVTLLEMIEKGKTATDASLLSVAQKCEAAMKIHAGEGGSHPYGTPTTAKAGSGPAVISGDLRRSITHEKSDSYLGGYRIGPASIVHTHYASRRKGRGIKGSATTGQIGEWLEAGTDKMPAYPFVQPALDDVKGEIEDTFKVVFNEDPW